VNAIARYATAVPTNLRRCPHFFLPSGSDSTTASAICHTASAVSPRAMAQRRATPAGELRICSIAPPWSASPPPPVATEMEIPPMTRWTMPRTT
jgi:hypothetical protein